MKPIQCPRCGKINDGSTDFCIYCGTIYNEYNGEEDDSSFFFIKTKGNRAQAVKLNQMPENLSRKKSYRTLIILGYFFAILGSVLGFIFAIYLITRNDPNAKKHGMIQLVVLIAEFAIIGFLIYSGQMDLNAILNPFNATSMNNMSQMNMTGSDNLSSLFGF